MISGWDTVSNTRVDLVSLLVLSGREFNECRNVSSVVSVLFSSTIDYIYSSRTTPSLVGRIWPSYSFTKGLSSTFDLDSFFLFNQSPSILQYFIMYPFSVFCSYLYSYRFLPYSHLPVTCSDLGSFTPVSLPQPSPSPHFYLSSMSVSPGYSRYL